jgi:hypothetical protein
MILFQVSSLLKTIKNVTEELFLIKRHSISSFKASSVALLPQGIYPMARIRRAGGI